MNKISLSKLGAKNPMWKGNKAGYGAIHDFVRSRKVKPKWCEHCGKRRAIDLANISQNYKRDLSDWEYLCRKCHMDGDGRNERLRQSGKSRKLPDRICVVCKKVFHRTSGMRMAKYCSLKCRNIGMISSRKCKLCERKHYSKGLCHYHYNLKRKNICASL